ncbi:TetR/AcrR family transcriptional regulator [Arthrobacter cryoconiti]|uniref:TetR/AcrR family transcriptional regulator n=1 Tax=Arthrobacter cryoconiti TaxID=748907 RepID=A0ABV8QXZ5_9MICC|nr:TetR/AcrR family transcriptional regulator [Arthrobacter cryoconiti]MCC9067726.1 TetR/AcrR family transcriptional regulator [Arthrobacter cryoconiti]
MAKRTTPGDPLSREQWAAQIAAFEEPHGARGARKTPLSIERILDTALQIVEGEGFDALSMRRVATALQTGPASLYAHVRNKGELDDLLIGKLCARVVLPTPDPRQWQRQIIDVCGQLREQFLRYPGISRATLATAPNSLDTLRVSEGMLAILLCAGVPAQSAAWVIDAAYLYVTAYSLESSLRNQPGPELDNRVLDRSETIERLNMLPANSFPYTVAHTHELTAGEGNDRFNFTLGLLFSDSLMSTSLSNQP